MMQRFRLTPTALAMAYLLLAPLVYAEDTGSPAASADYTVNPGDVLNVSVWKEDGMQSDVLVRPDGKFSFPLTGDIVAKGHSVDEIRVQLTEKLSRLIPDAVVSVSTMQIAGNKIYVIGQVNRPGEIIANPPLNIMQALSVAGGTTAFADLNDIRIIRSTANGQTSIKFRYRDIEKGKRLEQNIVLQAGDILVVP
jgi:polysaccharide export outer membrane protein